MSLLRALSVVVSSAFLAALLQGCDDGGDLTTMIIKCPNECTIKYKCVTNEDSDTLKTFSTSCKVNIDKDIEVPSRTCVDMLRYHRVKENFLKNFLCPVYTSAQKNFTAVDSGKTKLNASEKTAIDAEGDGPPPQPAPFEGASMIADHRVKGQAAVSHEGENCWNQCAVGTAHAGGMCAWCGSGMCCHSSGSHAGAPAECNGVTHSYGNIHACVAQQAGQPQPADKHEDKQSTLSQQDQHHAGSMFGVKNDKQDASKLLRRDA